MDDFMTFLISYTLILASWMLFILSRIFSIRKRAERRIRDFDQDYILPAYRRPWIFTIVVWVFCYVLSTGIIMLLLY